VVSFETIEHHDRHDDMMREIKRVLRKDGILIISSPDKYYYSILPDEKNEFHVKELFQSEFKDLLLSHFKELRMYGQKVLYGSAVLSNLCTDIGTYSIENGASTWQSGVKNPLYWIAVTSDSGLPTINCGIFEQAINDSDAVQAHLSDIDAYRSIVANVSAKVEELNSSIVERDQIIRLHNESIVERDRIICARNNNISDLDRIIQAKNEELNALANLTSQLQLEREQDRMAHLKTSMELASIKASKLWAANTLIRKSLPLLFRQ
jgi:hypothetical protein